ncbi:MAG: hypothetical protein EA350_16610 [Gemmatimonadales bacterium]|nr:MAG: hypothetical protein EA350_16610 [Gemmatimonadales bacterium]
MDRDPGVPEAEFRALNELLARVPAERVDGLWRFPPLRKGRKESGLLAAGIFPAAAGDTPAADPAAGRRVLVTLSWRAEETGKGVEFESTFQEEGEAPPDRLPRVMAGVVRRMDEATGEPRYLSVAGDAHLLQALLKDLEP